MKTKLFAMIAMALAFQTGQSMACAVCFGARDAKSTEHMAIAIWFLMGAVISVLGGVGAFGIHLWRHANIPLEPHEQLIDEDLAKYD